MSVKTKTYQVLESWKALSNRKFWEIDEPDDEARLYTEGFVIENYPRFKELMKRCSGQWVKKPTACHVFTMSGYLDLMDILNEGAWTEEKWDFFWTPEPVADMMWAEVSLGKPLWECTILEPSAGEGHLVDFLIGQGAAPHRLTLVEAEPHRAQLLRDTYDEAVVYNREFEDVNFNGEKFDLIFANPPFHGQRDIRHFFKMWDLLKDGGSIACLMSAGVMNGHYSIHKKFREWFKNNKPTVVEFDNGHFKEAGTNVATIAFVANKKESQNE